MIETLLEQVPNWKYDEISKEIRKTFEFKGYYKNMAFVNSIAWQAQMKNHHPELIINFKTCEVRLTTHDTGGLSEKDVEMALIIENLYF